MTSTPTPSTVGTVFVTGGSSGLGAAVVAAVLKAGGTPATWRPWKPPAAWGTASSCC